jgi:hypothetical protein
VQAYKDLQTELKRTNDQLAWIRSIGRLPLCRRDRWPESA